MTVSSCLRDTQGVSYTKRFSEKYTSTVGGTWIWGGNINSVGWEGNKFFQTMASCNNWSELAHIANMFRSTIRHPIPITIKFSASTSLYIDPLKTPLSLHKHKMFNDYRLINLFLIFKYREKPAILGQQQPSYLLLEIALTNCRIVNYQNLIRARNRW